METYRSGHNGTDSKSVVPSLVPWVRIPPSPPKMRLRPRKKPQGNFLRLLLFGGYFVGFIKSYKHLDNLCKDINGIGITGYINDMEDRPSAEYHIAGWKQDYLKLKHYRYIRNQIAHENYAEEENMSSPEDTVWLDNFYNRIINQTDPLALYYKETVRQQVIKPAQTVTPKNIPATSSSYHQYQKDRKPVGYAVMLIAGFVIILSLIVLFFFM